MKPTGSRTGGGLTADRPSCLFCWSDGPFNTIEHVIPESLGNDALTLEGHVCDSCQAYFGKEVERFVLTKTPIAFWRTYLGITTKAGRLPLVDFSQPRRDKGTLPATHWAHDDLVYEAHEDGSTSVAILDERTARRVLRGTQTSFRLVMTPKVLSMMGRFFCKVGVELLCCHDPTLARDVRFDPARVYARTGRHRSTLWPIFHTEVGEIGDHRRPLLFGAEGEVLLETATCYGFELLDIAGRATLLVLWIGTDSWVTCLDDSDPKFPLRLYTGQDVTFDALWYADEE